MSAKPISKRLRVRGPGRPATGKTVKKVSITLPHERWEKAEQFAFANSRPLSGIISDALAEYFGMTNPQEVASAAKKGGAR